MKKRDLLKWMSPIVVCVVLPSHAVTSEIIPIPSAPLDCETDENGDKVYSCANLQTSDTSL